MRILTEFVVSLQAELFGGDLSALVSNENSVPPLVDKLIQDIEARGKPTCQWIFTVKKKMEVGL